MHLPSRSQKAPKSQPRSKNPPSPGRLKLNTNGCHWKSNGKLDLEAYFGTLKESACWVFTNGELECHSSLEAEL